MSSFPPFLSIISQEGNAAVVKRINALTPVSKAGWGRMNVAQMLAHCQGPLKSGLARNLPKRRLASYIIGGYFKKRILGPAGFGKNAPTAPEFVINDDRSFEVERERLLVLVQKYSVGGLEIFPRDPHPLFGPMTPSEWDLFQAKHLDHHLRQFGV
jgi:hypothetical protein